MSQLKQKLAHATFKVLRPLVRVLLKNGISHAEFSEIARRAFVDVGFSDFDIDSRKQTVSRVSVLTGLSRKEVLRIKLLEDNSPLPETGPLNRATRVINGWLRDPEFISAEGKSLELPLYGDSASFAALVKRYSGDITAGAIFDELLRAGAVKKNGDRVSLCATGYVPQHGKEEKVDIMGICAADLLNTLEYNLTHNGEDSRFQRAVVYHRLPENVAREFVKLSKEKTGQLLVELNQWLAEQKRNAESDPNKNSNKRIGLGIYYFEDVLDGDKNEK
jgi:hypothetical protein